MRLGLLKPLNGWRQFLGEVGIIVVGVLVALGAQQVAEGVQTRDDVRAFRETINHEIGLNLFMYDVRARQFGCEAKRVGALRQWLDQARSGAQVPTIVARGPHIITPYRSAWDNRNAEVFNHLPSKVRQKYAEFYDELANNWSIMISEQKDWGSLAPYSEPGPISLADRRTIRPIIGSISGANRALEANLTLSRGIAGLLKVRAVAPDNIPSDWIRHIADCPSVIAPPGH